MATRKNTMRRIAALLLIGLGLIVAGCSTGSGGGGGKSEVTPEMVVEASYTGGDMRDVCDATETLGYDDALSYFRAGFDQGKGEEVSAEEAFDEILSRC